MYFLITLLILIGAWIFVRNRLNRKRTSKVGMIVFGLIFIVSVLLYLYYDRESSSYGSTCLFCEHPLPFGMRAKSGNYAGGLVLVDASDFESVGKGFTYQRAGFKMEDFLAYGYNDTSLIVKCTDSLDNINYLISYKTGYKNEKGYDEISFEKLAIKQFDRIKQKYSWVLLNEEQIKMSAVRKNLVLVGMIISLFFFIGEMINLRKMEKD